MCPFVFAQVKFGMQYLPSVSLRLKFIHLTSTMGDVPVPPLFTYLTVVSVLLFLDHALPSTESLHLARPFLKYCWLFKVLPPTTDNIQA